jgi:hypothetical protein
MSRTCFLPSAERNGICQSSRIPGGTGTAIKRRGTTRLNRRLMDACDSHLSGKKAAGAAELVSRFVLDGSTGAPSSTRRDTAPRRLEAQRSWRSGPRGGGLGRHRSPVPPNRGMAGRGACLRARWQKTPSYRPRKQANLPGGRPPVPPDCAPGGKKRHRTGREKQHASRGDDPPYPRCRVPRQRPAYDWPSNRLVTEPSLNTS